MSALVFVAEDDEQIVLAVAERHRFDDGEAHFGLSDGELGVGPADVENRVGDLRDGLLHTQVTIAVFVAGEDYEHFQIVKIVLNLGGVGAAEVVNVEEVGELALVDLGLPVGAAFLSILLLHDEHVHVFECEFVFRCFKGGIRELLRLHLLDRLMRQLSVQRQVCQLWLVRVQAATLLAAVARI